MSDLKAGEPFVPYKKFNGSVIPDWLEKMDLPLAAKVVYARLARYAGKDGKAWPSTTTLAEALNISRRTVSRSINALEEADLLRREERSGTSNLYRFIWQDFMYKNPPGAEEEAHGGGGHNAQGGVGHNAPGGVGHNVPQRESVGEESQQQQRARAAPNAEELTDEIPPEIDRLVHDYEDWPNTHKTWDVVIDLCDTFDNDWVLQALKDAQDAGANAPSWARPRLQDWYKKGGPPKKGADAKPGTAENPVEQREDGNWYIELTGEQVPIEELL